MKIKLYSFGIFLVELENIAIVYKYFFYVHLSDKVRVYFSHVGLLFISDISLIKCVF